MTQRDCDRRAPASAGGADDLAFANALPLLIWTCDDQGRLQWVTDRWTELTGLSEAETLHDKGRWPQCTRTTSKNCSDAGRARSRRRRRASWSTAFAPGTEDAGFAFHLVKPVDLDRLVEILDTLA